MAKLRISPELLVEAVFAGAKIEICGASFDSQRQLLLLDITGPEVPDAAEVEAICSVERFSVKFRPIGASVS